MATLPVLTAALVFLAGAFPARAEPARRALAIAAASNLRPAMDALAAAFEAEHPGLDVAVTAGASGAFFAQVRGGAPFDLFFSADRDYPRKLIEAGLASGGEAVYAVGRLVVWTPQGSPVDLAGKGLAALADPAVRKIAIANPAVAPYGRAAEAALASAGVLEAVRGRLVLGQSVAQAAQFARSGAADAALVPLSLALAPALRDGRTHPVPASLHPALEQSAVILRTARDPALAGSFLAFVTGPRGREILARAGYGLPRA
jgi:molybdate transport system substrate-binding protein